MKCRIQVVHVGDGVRSEFPASHASFAHRCDGDTTGGMIEMDVGSV